jgi:GGDEF domain-containing protein
MMAGSKDELIELASRLARYQGVDEQTGLPNLRQFLRELERELARARRLREWTVLLVLEPDEAVEMDRLSDAVRGVVRLEDLVARMGDRRLAVLLVATAPHAGRLVASRLQERARDLTTVSIGIRPVAPSEANPQAAPEILREAVLTLEEARATGGDLLVVWDSLIEGLN